MAERNDITVVQDVTPRYAEIAAPSTEIVMQDYVDTLRGAEDDFVNMSYPLLINASGKEDLGGGTLVAITVQEQNLQLAFESRRTPAETGTVTTASGPPSVLDRITFVDTAADFVTAGVQPGSYIVNWTDRSVSDVLRFIDANTLELKTPSLGTDNEYDLADEYTVWNVTQVRTSGGNLVAVDDNGSAIPAILPTWGTQVILTTSSSATLQELEDIQYASFNGGVTYNPTTGVSGTTFPTGTPRQPSNNFSDVVSIASERGLDTIYVRDSATIPTGIDFTGFRFVGLSAHSTVITVSSGATITETEWEECTISGDVDGADHFTRCDLDNVTGFNGEAHECGFVSDVALASTGSVSFIACYSLVPGSATPTLTVGSGATVAIRDYYGGLEIRGKTGTSAFSADFSSGQAIVNNNNTAGTINLRGIAKWTNKDTYAGTAVVDTTGLINQTTIAEAVWNALTSAYSAAGSFGQLVGRKVLTISKYIGLGRQ